MPSTRSEYLDPDFDVWRKRDALSLRQIAALMVGVEPTLVHEATSHFGGPLNLEDEIEILRTATNAGSLIAAPPVSGADSRTEVTRASLLPWLRRRGLHRLADDLEGPREGDDPRKRWTASALKELADLKSSVGTKAAAERFGISAARVRKLLPGTDKGPSQSQTPGSPWKAPKK